MDSITSSTKSDLVPVVLFVGSNPSNASTCDIAFHSSTKSSQILTGWTSHIKSRTFMHVNVSNNKTKDNRPLKQSEIDENIDRLLRLISSIQPCYVVALGQTAAKALRKINQPHYEMPHPSGRNRKLNDKRYVEEKIKGLVEFCSTNPIKTFTIA